MFIVIYYNRVKVVVKKSYVAILYKKNVIVPTISELKIQNLND